jgi:hypothetical protein
VTEGDPAGQAEVPVGRPADPAGADSGGETARPPDDPDGRFSRRSFLGGAAGLGIAIGALRLRAPALAARLEAEHERLLRNPHLAAEVPDLSPDFTLAVERDTDLLLLDFAFYGFTVDTHSHPRKLVANPKLNYIVIQFPPQAIGEATYYYPPTNSAIPLDPAPVLSALSGPSRLSFSLLGTKKVPFPTIPLPTMTAADLLDWSGWTLNVAPGAEAFEDPAAVSATAPTALQTWVECPYALILSPVVDARPNKVAAFETTFTNRPVPLTAGNVTDCWGARLTGSESGTAVKPNPNYLPSVAAVWSTDYDTAEVTAGPISIVYDP